MRLPLAAGNGAVASAAVLAFVGALHHAGAAGGVMITTSRFIDVPGDVGRFSNQHFAGSESGCASGGSLSLGSEVAAF